MKRLCAILLGLMMLAGLCACGRRTSPAPAPKTPEPVTVITPAQPTPSEAVPVSTPDGTTPLTAAELDWFGRCFFNVVPGWGPNRFLTCAYARPEDMDLAAVLACGPEGGWNVTSQERNMIAAGGTDSVVRIPLEQAQELMLRYTGLALSDTQGVGLDSLRYLSEYNAYYRVGDEAEAAYCRILSGWHTADGLTVLQYDGGTVTLSGWYGGLGYCVKIDHGNGFVTTYGHNSSLLVSVGQHVYKGQQIARMGSTGISSGPHCHFAVTRNGTLVDPLNYLP